MVCALAECQNTMNRNQKLSLRRSRLDRRVANYGVNAWRLAACSLAIGALVAQGPAQAADAAPVQESGAQAVPAQKLAYTPKGTQMERYKAFARQAELPAIIVTNQTTLEVGGAVKTDLSRLAQLSAQEQAALAGQFGVPAAVIGKVAERSTNNPPPAAAQIAQDMRTAVVDYRFLQGEWKRYNPPAEGQPIKAAALTALQAGDISKAWELYDGLQKPAPPANLRVIAEP